MTELTRRNLLCMGAAAALAPVLPVPGPKPWFIGMDWGSAPSVSVVASGNRLLTPAEFGRDAYALFRKHFPNSPTGLSEYLDNG